MDELDGRAVRRRRRLRVWVLLAVVFALALFNGPLLSGLAGVLCQWAAASHGMEFRAASLRCGVASPVVAGDVVLGFPDEGELRRVLSIETIEIRLNPPWEWFGRRSGGLFRTVRLGGVDCVLDTRSATTPIAEERLRDLEAVFSVLALPFAVGGAPGSLLVENATVDIPGDGSRVVARDVSCLFAEGKGGHFRVGRLGLEGWGIEREFGPLEAATSLDDGVALIAGLQPAPGVRITEVAVSAASDGGVVLSVRGDVFGGAIRGDARFGGGGDRSHRDVALFASDVPLAGIPELLGFDADAGGTLVEGRLTFRGDSGRPADAEASLRVVANDVRWNSSRWDSLELGASMIHRRLVVRDLDLRQGGNTVKANGELSLEDGWSKIAGAPFLLNLRARIEEPSLLGDLFGLPDGDTTGSLAIEGNVSGRNGEMDGFVGVRGGALVHRGVPIDRVAVDVVFKQSKAELEKLEIISGNGSLVGHGAVQLADPHRYRFSLRTTIDDVSRLLPLFPFGELPVSAGALDLEWAGEGTAQAHSGAFQSNLRGLVSRFTPAGLTGEFAGTYSPQNLYFSTIEMQSESLRLTSRATFAPVGGVRFDDLLIESGGKTVLEATGYFPVDPFAFFKGSDWIGDERRRDNLYVRASMPNGIRVSDLSRLAGQRLPFDGWLSLELEAYGPFASMDGRASLRCRGLEIGGVASKELVFDLRTLDGRATASGVLKPRRGEDVEMRAEFPFGLRRGAGGRLQWIDRAGAIDAEVVVPLLDLVLLRPLAPRLQGLRGGLRGRLAIGGTAGSPLVSGEAVVEDGRFGFGGLPAPLVDVGGRLVFDGGRVLFEEVEAACGGGTVRVSGGVDFDTRRGPEGDVAFVGSRVPLVDNGRVFLQGSFVMHARGGIDGGRLSGTIDLADSRIDAEPVIGGRQGGLREGLPFLFPGTLADLCASDAWNYDVRIGGGEVVPVGAGPLPGGVDVRLRLGGTRASPVVAGSLALRDVPVESPWGTIFADEGMVVFPGTGLDEAFVLLEDRRAGAIFGWLGPVAWYRPSAGIGVKEIDWAGGNFGAETTLDDPAWRLR